MQETIPFTKMHAIGNDFVVFDRIRQFFKVSPELLRLIADRHRGIGCDQILLLDPPSKPDADFEYRIFNQDGGEVEQCGNGARCVGRYLFQKGLTSKKTMQLHTMAGNIHIDVHNINHIKATLGHPQFSTKQCITTHPDVEHIEHNRYRIQLGQTQKEFSFVSLGNPHCVIFLPSLQEENLDVIATECQTHAIFPESVNVIFVQVLAKNHMKCRVFERHSGETQACGSGACAAAIAGIIKNEVNEQVQVDMPGGRLEVCWSKDQPVILGGETTATFEGFFKLSEDWFVQTA